jgi:hypothetical protein
MAIIPADEKVFMVDKRTNTIYGGSAALQAMQQWYTMQDVADSIQPYKVFTALLTQSGITPPTAFILENTLGFTPIWEYVDPGAYRANSPFFTEKTAVFLGSPYVNFSNEVVTLESARTPSGGGSVAIQSKIDGVRTNGVLFNTPIEIRVYN